MNAGRVLGGAFLTGFPALVLANAGSGVDQDPIMIVIFWVSLIFAAALTGRYLAKRLNQPGVLGELLMGIAVGNVLYYIGVPLFVVLREGSLVFNIMRDLLGGQPLTAAVSHSISNPHYAAQMLSVLMSADGIDLIKLGYVLDIFSRYGVIFLLFMVGLESSIEEMKHTGSASIKVAILGVIAPIVLGYAVMCVLMPAAPFSSAVFVAATLSATSIGITARVLSDMKKLRTREAKTVLGAAMLDDVLGLIILAVVSSVVLHGQIDILGVVRVVVFSGLFFIGALTLGPWVLKYAIRCFDSFALWEAKLFVSFLFLMVLSWLATQVQLASIIGAFAAGLIIHDGLFESDKKQHRYDIQQLIAPLEAIFAPLFFVLIGIQVKLETFLDWHVLLVSAGLIIAAVLGKLVSGLGASRKEDRLLIGIGMLPRGEVGLVFASIGRTLGCIDDALFSSIILMVLVTTLMAPPWLKSRFAQRKPTVEGI